LHSPPPHLHTPETMSSLPPTPGFDGLNGLTFTPSISPSPPSTAPLQRSYAAATSQLPHLGPVKRTDSQSAPAQVDTYGPLYPQKI